MARYWWDYDNDLVGGTSDEPRVPTSQLNTLYRHNPGAMNQGRRSQAWAALVARPARPGIELFNSKGGVWPIGCRNVWVSRFGVAINVVVSALVAQLLFLTTGPDTRLLAVIVAAVAGLLAGSVATRALTELSRTAQQLPGGGRR